MRPLINTLDERTRRSAPHTCPGGPLTTRAPSLQRPRDMSLMHSRRMQEAVEARRMPSAEILAYFEKERKVLLRLALVITGDAGRARHCFMKARDMALQAPNPFCERFTEWRKVLIIEAALSSSYDAICSCGPDYANLQCIHLEHLVQTADSKLEKYHNFLFRIDPSIIIASLDTLSRAVLILRTTARVSILDCTRRLELSPDTILAANCRAMSWIAHMQQRDPRDSLAKDLAEVCT
jgi:hypothetical protein